MLEMPQNLREPELSENTRIVLEKRYFRKDEHGNVIESPKEFFWRVASSIAEVELQYKNSPFYDRPIELAKQFYALMINRTFLPNSPTLMNAGTDMGQLAACFVLPIEDSIEGIFNAVKYAAMIHKSGGGTGFSFSRLRPKNSVVGSTGGVASGPMSFMKIFDVATEQIKQGGKRRGANLGLLRVDHPDIIEFINAKEKDGVLTNFNLSVGLTEDFMNAVENNSNYNIIDPRDKKVVGKRNAKEVFELLVKKAWISGDPGIIFLDRMNRDNPNPDQGEIESTNPCLRGSTRILTDKGYREIRECVCRDIKVWNGVEWSEVTPRITGYDQEMLRVTCSDGSVLDVTPYHKFILNNGQRVEARELKEGDGLIQFELPVIESQPREGDPDLMWCRGFYAGDGTRRKGNTQKTVVNLYNGKKELLPRFQKYMRGCNLAKPERLDVYLKNELMWQKDFVPNVSFTIAERLSYLAGIIDADGTRLCKNGSIGICSSDYGYLKKLKELVATLGCKSTLSLVRPEGKREAPDGKGGKKLYNKQAEYRLSISGWYVVKLKELGLKTYRVDISHNANRNCSRMPRIVSVEKCENADIVYCLTEPQFNQFVAEGIIVGNCAEQPLLPYEACNLGSINLSKFYDSKTNAVNYTALGSTVCIATRFLDNVIDASKYPIEQITENVRRNRKIGLGVMGFADLLFQIGIPYDSEEALDLAADLMGFINERSKSYSRKLAEERGAFPAFATSVYKDDRPLRNATRTTIAPTGTLSIIAECSSGIEPLFALAFTRNVMDGQKLTSVSPYLEKALVDAGMHTPEIMEAVASKGSIQHIEEIPEHIRKVFVTAMDIEPIWHLRMQAAFQKHTDNAVSKTVNLPNSATEQDIYDIYWQAYLTGCKGVTVYRDGCKATQVLNTGDGQKRMEGTAPAAPAAPHITRRERPDIVQGFTQKVQTGLGTMYLTVNEVDGKPFEVFATIGKSGRSITAKAEAVGRLVSLALRSGVDVRDVVTQIKGIGGEHPVFRGKGLLLSIPDAIARVLEKRYLQDAPVSIGNDLERQCCPECGEPLTLQEGCMLCQACGYSKCG